MKVPFLDLKAQYTAIKNEIDEAIAQVIDTCAFAGGPFVEKFEYEFAQLCNCEHAIGVGSGTEALWLSLSALGIGKGDEVITVPNTFIATAEAISLCGAKPVFVDIDENSYNMDVVQIRGAITRKTKAIIPVHLFGRMADMDPIMEIAKEYELFVVEDACQAHGAEYKEKKAGSIGTAGCFSFYPGKNLGAYGDAGAVTTNDRHLADRIRRRRDHGQKQKYIHVEIGCNARMDGLQGAILSVKLKNITKWNDKRRNIAALYDQLLPDNNWLNKPKRTLNGKHVYHIYAVRTNQRDRLVKHLHQNQIQTGIHYPIPIHLQEAYREEYGDTHFPIAEKCCSELLSLPIYPEMPVEFIEHVSEQLKMFEETVG